MQNDNVDAKKTMTDAEIVKALRQCTKCIGCQDCKWIKADCGETIMSAAETIQRLQERIKELEAERDAAVEDIKVNWLCAACQKRVKGKEWCYCKHMKYIRRHEPEEADGCENFEWHGKGKDG